MLAEPTKGEGVAFEEQVGWRLAAEPRRLE